MQPAYPNRRNPELGSAGRLIPAMVLIGLGSLFLLHNLNLFVFRDILRYWPAILMAIGLVKLVDSDTSASRVGGGVMLAVGGVLLLQTLGIWDVRMRDLWPLVLIALGLFLLFQRAWEWPALSSSEPASSGTLDENAIFGGGKRKVVSQDFRGGQVSAVFGGFEIDLRKAGMAGEKAELEANSVFGGIEIVVPRHWSVVMKGSGVFGGFGDETVQPDPGPYPPPQLIVKGAAVFGGVVVKN